MRKMSEILFSFLFLLLVRTLSTTLIALSVVCCSAHVLIFVFLSLFFFQWIRLLYLSPRLAWRYACYCVCNIAHNYGQINGSMSRKECYATEIGTRFLVFVKQKLEHRQNRIVISALLKVIVLDFSVYCDEISKTQSTPWNISIQSIEVIADSAFDTSESSNYRKHGLRHTHTHNVITKLSTVQIKSLLNDSFVSFVSLIEL